MPAEAPLAGREDIRRILIVKWSALGDVVIASALMEDMARAFPQAEIHLNTLPPCAALFAHDPRFRAVFAIDVRQKRQRWRRVREWLQRVRQGRYDLVVDLQRTDHTRFLLALLQLTGRGIRHRLGSEGGFPYSLRTPPVALPRRDFDVMRAMLTAAGIPTRSEVPVLHAGPDAQARVAALLAELGLATGRYAVLLPGSQAAGWLKRWGAARYAEVAQGLAAAGMERVLVIGGPDEVEDCAAIAQAGSFVANLNGRIGLLEIAPLCAGAALIVANDTGTAHIAAAADRPMLVICGPTDPRRVKPIGPKVRAIQAVLPCLNCYAKDCPEADYHACMRLLTPEIVAAEALSLAALAQLPDNAVYRRY